MKWWKISAILLVVWLLLNVVFGVLFFAEVGWRADAIAQLHNADDGLAWVFIKCVFLSLQTGQGIGYGYWAPMSAYTNAIAVCCCYTFIVSDAVIASIIFLKITRPTLLRRGMLFSSCAVVSYTASCFGSADGTFPTLQMRVLNTNALLSMPTMRLLLLRQEHVPGSRTLHWKLHELNFEMFAMDGRSRITHMGEPQLRLPWTVSHTLDPSSPLYWTSAEEMEHVGSEIILLVEGVNEATGAVFQCRWSYIPSEIVWRARFDSCTEYQDLGGTATNKPFQVDASKLSSWIAEPEPATDWTPPPSSTHIRETLYYERPIIHHRTPPPPTPPRLSKHQHQQGT